jgi:hypothetical protein
LSFPRRYRFDDADTTNPHLLDGVLELHYSVKQIAASWGLCENAVRDIFRNEPGVVRIHRPKSRNKRAYTTLRIPRSVVERVHCRMSVFA